VNNTVRRTLYEKCGFCRNDRIIVALSGGADSVTLLSLLLRIRDEDDNMELFAAHVNHNLRGEESDRDESFVRNLCKEQGIELFVLNKDVEVLAKEKGQSIELCAREVRYEFFEELSRKLGAKVATAHTLSDCEETTLYNICRGASLHGLCSIPYKRDYIIRPLLDITRRQVEEYCKDNNLSYVQDSTNFLEDMCKRNKIRLSLMPLLYMINSGFDKNYYRLRESLLLADDYLTEESQKALEAAKVSFGYSAEALLSYHRAVLRCALADLIRSEGIEPDNTRICLCEEILSKGGAVELSQGVYGVCKQGLFRITHTHKDTAQFEIPFKTNSEFLYEGKKYSVKVTDTKDIVHRKLSSFCIGCDKIDDGVLIRTRRAGDIFTLLHRGVTKPLRKLQNELKIPSEQREKALVAAKGSTVLWAQYIGVSAQGAVEKDSSQGILIECEDI